MSDEIINGEFKETTTDFRQYTQEATNHFFAAMQERHEKGQEKYGPIKFMEVNTLIEAMEEVVDLGNYAMYTYIKLYVLNQQLQKLLPAEGQEPLGAASFMKSGE